MGTSHSHTHCFSKGDSPPISLSSKYQKGDAYVYTTLQILPVAAVSQTPMYVEHEHTVAFHCPTIMRTTSTVKDSHGTTTRIALSDGRLSKSAVPHADTTTPRSRPRTRIRVRRLASSVRREADGRSASPPLSPPGTKFQHAVFASDALLMPLEHLHRPYCFLWCAHLQKRFSPSHMQQTRIFDDDTVRSSAHQNPTPEFEFDEIPRRERDLMARPLPFIVILRPQ